MDPILSLATILMPVTTGVTEAIKRMAPISKDYMPAVAIVIGVALGAVSSVFTDADIGTRIWAGGISGLAATGLFELGKQSMKKNKGGTK